MDAQVERSLQEVLVAAQSYPIAADVKIVTDYIRTLEAEIVRYQAMFETAERLKGGWWGWYVNVFGGVGCCSEDHYTERKAPTLEGLLEKIREREANRPAEGNGG